MKIRRAKISDAPSLSRLRRGVFGKVKGERYSKKFVDLINKTNSPKGVIENIKSFDVFCLVKGERIIGTVGLKGNKIKGLYVRKSCARKGIGTRLMNFIENYAKKKNLKKLILYSEEKARDFYEKLGYKALRKETSYEVGIKKVNYIMEKRLR